MDGIGSIVISSNPLASFPGGDTDRKTLFPGDWKAGSYQHEIQAMGGFWAASFQLLADRIILEDWLENGLGWHVRSFLPDGRLAWEGFVNTLRLEIAGTTFEVSLDNMANRVWTAYTTSAPSQEVGSTVQINDAEALARLLLFKETNKTRSTKYNNLISQDKYGIKEIVLSGGDMTAIVANQTAQAYLGLAFDPVRGQMRLQRGSERNREITLTIECQGYMRTLNWRTYNHTGGSTAQVSALISTIVTAIGQYIASKDIETNPTLVSEDYDSDRFAENVLFDLARISDAEFNRYVLGVFDDRKLIYKKAAIGGIENPVWTQEADLEENNLTDFNSTVAAGGGSIAASAAAALAGAYGCACTLTLGTAGDTAYGTLSGTTNQKEKTVEVLFDPNGLTMANLDLFNICSALGSGPSAGGLAFDIRLRFRTGIGYEISPSYFDDAPTQLGLGFIVITDAPHKIRVVWKAATGAGNNDGYYYAYIDDVLIGSATGIDNDQFDIDSVRFGAAANVDAGMGGTIYIDNCRVYDGIAHPIKSYPFYMANADGSITDPQNRKVNLAEIRPDKWLRESRIFSARLRQPSSLYEDISAVYIESVRFQEPDTITIIGNKGNQLGAVLSKLSLSGLGAI